MCYNGGNHISDSLNFRSQLKNEGTSFVVLAKGINLFSNETFYLKCSSYVSPPPPALLQS